MPKRDLDRFSRFCTAHGDDNTQTKDTHTDTSVAIGNTEE